MQDLIRRALVITIGCFPGACSVAPEPSIEPEADGWSNSPLELIAGDDPVRSINQLFDNPPYLKLDPTPVATGAARRRGPSTDAAQFPSRMIRRLPAAAPYRVIRLVHEWRDSPAFTLELHHDGTSNWIRDDFDRETTRHEGSCGSWDFILLSCLLDRLRIREMQPFYSVGGCGGWDTISATNPTTGATISVRDHGGGPLELWAIRETMLSIAHRIDWKPAVR